MNPETLAAIASVDPEVHYILSLEAKQEAAEEASEAVFIESDIEVDSSSSVFDVNIYRVWRGVKLLGTFHRSIADDKWVAEPYCCKDRNRYDTPNEAQAAVIAAWSNQNL